MEAKDFLEKIDSLAKWHEFRLKVHNKKLKKAGHNQHLRFSYFELTDLENIIYEVMQETGYNFGLFRQELRENIMTFEYQFEGKTVFEASYLHDTQQGNKIQGSGSTSTYGHRYSLMRIFGFAEPDSDPDNEKNMKARETKPKVEPKIENINLNKFVNKSLKGVKHE